MSSFGVGQGNGETVFADRVRARQMPFLKCAAARGVQVVNNPFWWSADEKFFNNCLATKLGVAVPMWLPVALLPSLC